RGGARAPPRALHPQLAFVFELPSPPHGALMNCTEPPLTTVRQPIEAMGRAVVELLNAQINGGQVAAEELLFEPELVVRGSTAQAPRT
ncbi:substrate-binding domain-containing protein, partial [Streptomyces hirsutus]|uniref:substrate-binding domain-containing protein n=1 Tax=Streptomyces hirsutus TaxID=35620 RepID=UPI003663D4C9